MHLGGNCVAYQWTYLKESNEFLNSVLNNIDAGVFILDKRMILREFNRAFTIIFGTDDKSVLGMLCGNATKCVHAVDEEKACGTTSRCGGCKLRRSILRALNGRIPTIKTRLAHDFYIQGKRIVKHLECSTKCVTIDNEDVTLVIIRDLTESETQKLELLQSHERITSQNAELESAYTQLHSAYQRMEREHGIAEEVLARLSSKDYHRFPNIRVRSAPFETVGGDVFFSAGRPSGELHLLLGDFTGHGLSAALGALPTSDIFFKMTADGHSIEEILGEINRKLKSILPASLFLCASMIEINQDQRPIAVWNGGLPDVLVVTGQGEVRHRIGSNHVPLGILDNKKFDGSLETVSTESGDSLYAYSDGIIEAFNLAGEMFGQERLEAAFDCPSIAGWRIDRVVETLNMFCQGRTRDDDFTISEVKLTENC
jgi:serine phosphatase RsbU (regulator of sigma subunit)